MKIVVLDGFTLNPGDLTWTGFELLGDTQVHDRTPHVENSLLAATNCLITPHISWATQEARTRLMNIAVENLKQFLAGTPVNVVHVS